MSNHVTPGANIDIISLATQIVWVLGTIAVVIAVGAGVYFAYRYLDKLAKYKYNVEIIEQVGKEGNFGKTDIAREVKQDGKYFLELLKTRDAGGKRLKIGVPDPEYLVPYGLRKKLFLSKWGPLLTPMNVVRNSPANFHTQFEDLIALLRWREQDHIRALDTYTKKRSFWQENQVLILFSTAMTILLVMAFVLIWQLQNLEIVVDLSQRIV